ncbi:MAG: hypothetical protein ABI472_18085 [Ginsengibacter sp.]
MNTLKNLLYILIIFIFVSCQKELSTNDPGTSPSSSKVKTYTEDVTSGGAHSVTTFNLAYDASDRLISLVSATSSGDKFEYQYSNGSYTMDLYNSNLLSIHEIFFINSNLLVDSSFQYNDTKDSMTEKYVYNSAGQLTTLKQYDYSQVTGAVLFNVENYTYDSNGNTIRVTETSNNSVTTYEYYTNLVNNLYIFNPYVPGNKNLVMTTINDSGGSTTTLSHFYTFDSANRLITEKITADTGEIVIKTYTY